MSWLRLARLMSEYWGMGDGHGHTGFTEHVYQNSDIIQYQPLHKASLIAETKEYYRDVLIDYNA